MAEQLTAEQVVALKQERRGLQDRLLDGERSDAIFARLDAIDALLKKGQPHDP